MAIADLDGNGKQDIVIFMIDNPHLVFFLMIFSFYRHDRSCYDRRQGEVPSGRHGRLR